MTQMIEESSTPEETPAWLLVIDMQPAFGNPDSPWAVPGYEECAQNIAQLVTAFKERVLFTRFVPPEKPTGSWHTYYEHHPFALEPHHQALWELDPRWRSKPSVSSHRFAKWHEAAPRVPKDATVVLCGVATDCCVLGTALEASDDGRTVRLVTDACAAGTHELHNAALQIMADRVGQVQFSNTDRERSAACRAVP